MQLYLMGNSETHGIKKSSTGSRPSSVLAQAQSTMAFPAANWPIQAKHPSRAGQSGAQDSASFGGASAATGEMM